MCAPGKSGRAFFAGAALLGALLLNGAAAGAALSPPSGDVEKWLQQAEDEKTSDHSGFLMILDKLTAQQKSLTQTQALYLRFFKAWEMAYEGNDEAAIPLIEDVIAKTSDTTLRYRAGLVVTNILANRSRYEEAFARLSQSLGQLPSITDPRARRHGLASASLSYEEAGQHDLAVSYADQLIKESAPDSEFACKAYYSKLASLFKSSKLDGIDPLFRKGLDTCLKAGDALFANGIRFYAASLEIQRGHVSDGIKTLQKSYPEVQRSGYQWLIGQYDALLAGAYMSEGETTLANQFALAAVGASRKNAFAESLITAYRVLYLEARQKGDTAAALAYHEKYMETDKGYLSDVSAKALAYQVVNQQVLAKKLQIDTLNKQNQILQLQQTLSTKAIETTRLYIVLLLTVLASIAFWAYRVKRSQLRFMKLARRDGLTGIFNRQHFVSAAELQLQYCQKSGRVASLIVIDLDHFKIVNDTHGHAVGDHVLRRAVAACQAHLRSTDVFGRLGGEEFGILMPECDSQRTAGRADLIRMAIASVSDSDEAQGVEVSASFGVSSTTHSSYNLRQLLIHADKALYSAKREGRNRVVLFDSAGQVNAAALTHQSLASR